MPSEEIRFWSKVRIAENGCWEWQGGKSSKGYGRFKRTGDTSNIPAHKYAYNYCIGPIPEGLEPDHLCRNRGCVNPWHLEPVTHRVNVLRGVGPCAINAAQTHCRYGHLLTGDNVKLYRGSRYCRTCCRRWGRERYQRLKASGRIVMRKVLSKGVMRWNWFAVPV